MAQQQQHPAPIPQEPPLVEAHRPVRTAVVDRPSVDCLLKTWISGWTRLVVAAEVEEWDDGDRRRVATGKLIGVAAQWQDRVGRHFPAWGQWVEQLRAAFIPQLTMVDCGRLVEDRKQKPRESGVQYALEKLKISHRCPVNLPEPNLIPYLIRGLDRPEHVESSCLHRPSQCGISSPLCVGWRR